MKLLLRIKSVIFKSAFILVLHFVFAPVFLSAQTDSGAYPGNDLTTHRFRPDVSPRESVETTLIPGSDAGHSGIGSNAIHQINALVRDKLSRTPAQRKIASQLIYTARMLQNRPAAEGVPYLETGVELDHENRLFVDIVADVSDVLLERLKSEGASVVNSHPNYRSIRALIPSDRLEWIAAWPEIRFINPRQPFTTHGQGSVTTEGEETHRADEARSTFGVSGAGIKIGVISNGVDSLADSQASGDLGHVTVLPGQGGSGDEGTAMLEIIHDLAPGAQLYFATAANGIAGFAQNIEDLRAAGCDIIVDDVSYLYETPFQDGQAPTVFSNTNGGIVIQAVNNVTADGALYFSSAGNGGNITSGTAEIWEGDFVDGGAAGAPFTEAGSLHSFGATAYNEVTGIGLGTYIFWSDPLGASSNDYDLYHLSSDGSAILSASTNIQNGIQDPFEFSTSIVSSGERIVIFRNDGADERYLHLGIWIGGDISEVTSGATRGHNAARNGYGVAATPALVPYLITQPVGPWPNHFSAADMIEIFSSDGPRRIFFNADGSPITPGDFSSTGGQLLQKPDITAADGVSVTGAGGFPSPFYGTSAAAPHAAAIAALIKSADLSMTNDEVGDVLTQTAVDIMDPGPDRDSGAGIVMAYEAVDSLGVSGFADPILGTVTASENPGDGDGDINPGEGVMLGISLANTFGVDAATNISATLTTSTPGVIITQPASSDYPDIAAGGEAANLAPFTFTLASQYPPCNQPVQFTLSVSFTGGPSATREFTFEVPVGEPPYFIDGILGTPPDLAGITAATDLQIGRIYRNGVASTCENPKTWPGIMLVDPGIPDTDVRVFDSYTFTPCSSHCMNIELLNPTVNTAMMFSAAYSPYFNPDDLSENYAGDPGISSTRSQYFINVTEGSEYTIVVHEVFPLTAPALGEAYTLKISGCAFNCSIPNSLPVAIARNVTVAVGPGGTADASVDNGSYDPDGDPISITQTPAGPYDIGITSVMLTVVDDKGATAQANATVEVLEPADMALVKSHSGVFTQGQAGATFTLTATNVSSNATLGTVTVTDSLPAELTATAMSGTGWDCSLSSLTCSRSDSLPGTSSYPPITLTVDVDINAPDSVSNSATVSLDRDTDLTNNSAVDPAAIDQATVDFASSTTSPVIRRGYSSTTTTLTLSGNADFANSFDLSYENVSGPDVTCQFQPSTTPVSIAGNSVTMTIRRPASAANHTPTYPGNVTIGLASLFFLPMTFFVPWKRFRRGWKKYLWISSGLVLLLLMISFGCGNSGQSNSHPPPPPPPDTYSDIRIILSSGGVEKGDMAMRITLQN